MKKIGLLILRILTIISSFSSASSIDPMNLPKFTHFVNDYSNVFTEEQRLELGMLAKNIETNSGYQIVTVLFPHREGNELFDIALKAFNENKIGDKERNDGLLLAIATEEKKIRIVVGYGLEDKIPDLLAKQIIETLIRPEVNNGNFHQGIKNFYNFFLDESVQNQFSDQSSDEEDLRSQMIFLGVYTIFLLLLIIRGSSGKGGRSSIRNRWDRRNNSTLGSILGGGWSGSSSSGGWSGGSSRGRGGFSGGGGRSGGGGAGD
ncbi:MAG: TPM domain-containing protein [candidate division SR1 bacterium]|nr:TPM domain-containing protein [candidate division SR1 bacterium]